MGKKVTKTNRVKFARYVPPEKQKAIVKTTEIQVQEHNVIRTAATYFHSAGTSATSQTPNAKMSPSLDPIGTLDWSYDSLTGLEETVGRQKRKRAPAVSPSL